LLVRCVLATTAALVAFAQPVAAAPPIHGMSVMQSPFAGEPFVNPAEAAYCRQTGGRVEIRTPVYGTNNSSSAGQLQLAGQAAFCRWQMGTGSTSSRIYTLLSTLNATLPTLAALAYYAELKSPSTCGGGGNPASCYCTYLGGSDQFGGTNLAGGAWVLPSAPVDKDLEACIFPDLSSIDSWGLFYHSAKIIRGIDLSKVLKYHKPKNMGL